MAALFLVTVNFALACILPMAALWLEADGAAPSHGHEICLGCGAGHLEDDGGPAI